MSSFLGFDHPSSCLVINYFRDFLLFIIDHEERWIDYLEESIGDLGIYLTYFLEWTKESSVSLINPLDEK